MNLIQSKNGVAENGRNGEAGLQRGRAKPKLATRAQKRKRDHGGGERGHTAN